MTILITGSSGKTASKLTQLLAPTHSILVASRKPKPDAAHPTVRFDWLDASTYPAPFDHAVAQQSPITAVYLVSPDVAEAREKVIAFVDYAAQHGVKRFVLLSAWEVPEGGHFMGPVHAKLRQMGGRDGVEWTVLRPHFFMENFAEGYHLASIKNEGKLYTAAGEGSKPFIAAGDIAAVARVALIDGKAHNTDHYITGPASLTYDDVAQTLSEVLGKKVEHVKLSREEFRQKLLDVDFSPDMAEYMADLDVKVSQGEGSEVTDIVQKVTGKPPRSFLDFVKENKHEWA